MSQRAVAAGQVWRPVAVGGMWRTILGVHPAGVEWSASPNEHAFSRWETWDAWVRATAAQCHG